MPLPDARECNTLANGLEQLSRAAAMAGAIASMSTGMSFQLFQNRFGRCL
jgi:hypothetical protein